MLTSVLGGCSSDSADTDDSAESIAETESSQGYSAAETADDSDTAEGNEDLSESDHYPVTITTYNYAKEEVEVTFQECPTRVICTNQTQTELMLYFGLDEYIAGTAYLDGSIRSDLKDSYDALVADGKELTVTGYPEKEVVLSLEPDFIFGWRSAFADTALGDVDEWLDLGIGTMILRCSNNTADDRSINSVLADIADLGAIFNIEDQTDAYIAEAEALLLEINDHVSGLDEKLNVLFLEADGDGIWYAWGADTLTGSLPESAGAVNLVPDSGADLSAEDIIAYNPDAIIIDYMGGQSGEEEEEREAYESAIMTLTSESSLAEVSAVASDRIMAVNLTDVYAGGIRILPSLEAIYEFLYG